MFLVITYHTRTTFTGRFSKRFRTLQCSTKKRLSSLFIIVYCESLIFSSWHVRNSPFIMVFMCFDTIFWHFYFCGSMLTHKVDDFNFDSSKITWWSLKVPLQLQLIVSLLFIVIETLGKRIFLWSDSDSILQKILTTKQRIEISSNIFGDIQVRLRNKKPMLIINLFHDR